MNILNTFMRFGGRQLMTLFSSSPTKALNYFLQSLFFSLSLTSLCTSILLALKFPYASSISSNSLFKSLLLFLFLYLQIWTQSSQYFIPIGYACAIFIAIYVYDWGMGIAEGYVKKIRGFYWGQVAAVIGVTLGLLGIVWGLGRKGGYSGKGVIGIFGIMVAIFVINAIRNKHVVYSAVPCLTMLMTIIFRIINESSTYTKSIPIWAIPLLMMAFTAEYYQRNPSGSPSQSSSVIFQLLKSTSSFFLYALLNSNPVFIYIEIIIGIVWIVVGIVKF